MEDIEDIEEKFNPMRDIEDYLSLLALFFIILFVLFIAGCSSIDTVTVKDYPTKTWVTFVSPSYEFSGRFVSVEYSGTKTVGLRLEEPLGPGWRVFKIKEGDILMGMQSLVFLKNEDWKKAWTFVRQHLGQEVITIGILKLNSDGSYAQELQWYELRRKEQ